MTSEAFAGEMRRHLHWAKFGECVTQVSAIGPLGLEYLDLGGDPANIANDALDPRDSP
jgi:hypothetical protein